MAMNLKPTKAKSKVKFGQNLVVILLVIALITTVFVFNAVSSAGLEDTVTIAVLKESLPKDGVLQKCDPLDEGTWVQFEKKEMMAMEYQKLAVTTRADGTSRREVVLWEDLPRIVETGAYAGVYIAAGRPIYYSDLSNTGTQKNSYLYQMDGELIRLDITPDDFGDMVVPGDKLNIRITYETDDYTLPTQEEYKRIMDSDGEISETITVTEMLFSEVAILDMINGNGESIFDLYYELLTLPEAERSTIINSDDFKSRVAPSNILLSVTAEEADRYARIKGLGGEYLITLLPRDGTTEILDALDELQVGFARQ